MNETWAQLALYESRDVVSRLYQSRHGGELSASKAKEIVSAVAQSRAYFASAADAAPLVSPLLQYYGVLSLARALNLFLLRDAREASLAASHGLAPDSWGQTLAEGIRKVDSISVTVCHGSFRDLLRATNNREFYVVDEAPRPNRLLVQKWGNGSDPIGTVINFKDVLGRLPELHDTYEAVYESAPSCFRASVFIVGPQADITLNEGKAALPETQVLERALRLAPQTPWRTTVPRPGTTEVRTLTYRVMAANRTELLDQLPPIKCNAKEEEFVVLPFDGNRNYSTLALFFMASYILGMFVRYYPSSWLALLGREKGDFIMPLLDVTRTSIQQRFPEVALKHLQTGYPSGFDSRGARLPETC